MSESHQTNRSVRPNGTGVRAELKRSDTAMSLKRTLCESDILTGDPLAEYGISGFHDGEADACHAVIRTTMVYRRLRKLGIEYRDIIDTLSGVHEVYRSVKESAGYRRGRSVAFPGTRVSELNGFVSGGANITVSGGRILFDEPLFIEKSVHVDFRRCSVSFDPAFRASHSVVVRDAEDVVLKNLSLEKTPCSGIIVTRSKNVCVSGCRLTGTNGCPLTLLGDSERLLVHGNTIEGFGFAGIHLQGRVARSVIENNEVSGGTGTYNGHPGIFVGDREGNLPKPDDFSPRAAWPLYRYAVEKVSERFHGPTENIIVSNRFAENKGSGIYSDGAMLNFYAFNVIENNGKEGACFDFGSTGNVFFRNTVTGNGRRAGYSDKNLKSDYVLEHGRMPDGTAKAKVPGISLDNALYNIVLGNTIGRNYGGGIKCVRSGFYNIIGDNRLENNNRGRNDQFHFFGIELGAAPAENDKQESDICPSVGNIVFGNSIGGGHYAGIFIGEGCVQNDIIGNSIKGSSTWAIESVAVQENYFSENISEAPSVNVPETDPENRAASHKLIGRILHRLSRLCK